MSDKVRDQYEAFPYPERNPKDERDRLITGSPSHPLEIDHFLFQGQRDWGQGTRILVAGGGTGDALIQIAQILTTAGKPYEITYLDLSTASRDIAEARAKIRGLKGITFLTGSLLDAPDYGPFDYIDCCGVLHHLPDPQAGFDALSAALAPDGGMGCMVYAPYGRAGVYPLQEAFGVLLAEFSAEEKLTRAKAMFETLPEGHPFTRNPHLVDHKISDAGFYDLLLHAQDRPFTIDALDQAFRKAGLELTGLPQAAAYDLSRFVDAPKDLSRISAMALAEKLDGTIKLHVAYAKKAKSKIGVATGQPSDIPHLKGVSAKALAQKVAASGTIPVTLNGTKFICRLPKQAASALSGINGQRSLADIRKALRLDPIAWSALWTPAAEELTKFGLLYYSRLLRG